MKPIRSDVTRSAVASLVGSLVFFVFGGVVWVTFGLADAVTEPLPDHAELSAYAEQSGAFLYPRSDDAPAMDLSQPYNTVMVFAKTTSFSPVSSFGTLMGVTFVALFIACYVTLVMGRYGAAMHPFARWMTTFIIGVNGAIYAHLSVTPFWPFPAPWTMSYIAYEIVGWLMASLITTAMLHKYWKASIRI